MAALEEGKKVRRKNWPSKEYIHNWKQEDGSEWMICASICLNSEWELYEEPEKTYSFMEVVKGLKDGKKFKRKTWGEWYIFYCLTGATLYVQGKQKIDFSPYSIESFEATDWVEVG